MDKLIFSDEELVQLSKYAISNSVADLLEQYGGDIDKLKSYIKWLYKYGGTGSKGGNGDGEYGTDKWSIVAYINNQTIKNPTILDENNPINNVSISISRPGSDSYTVSVYYKKETDSKSYQQGSNIVISAENNLCTIPVKIIQNGELSIRVINNSTGTTKNIDANCILNAHSTSLTLINNNNIEYKISNNILSYDNIINGLKLRINHRVYVHKKSGENITLKINITHPISNLNNGNYNEIIALSDYAINPETNDYYTDINLFDILGFSNRDKEEVIGTYFFNYVLEYTYNSPQKIPKTTNITIIPANELYLLIRPVISDAKIYNAQQNIDENLYLFTNKNIKFNITPYKPGGGTVVLDIKKNNNQELSYILDSNTISQKQIICENSTSDIYENKIEFTLYNDSTKTIYKKYTYYIYLDKQSQTLNWFDDTKNILREYKFFEFNNDIESIDQYNSNNISINTIHKYQNNNQGPLMFNLISNDSNKEFIYEENITTYAEGQDLLISIALQYSEINDTSKKIFELKFNDDENRNIYIYQNKIVVGKTENDADKEEEEGIEIFIPLEKNYNISNESNYHILNILIRQSKNINKYELLFYIDGLIENAYQKSFASNQIDEETNHTSGIRLRTFGCYEGNYAVNLFDVVYLSNPEEIKYEQINDNDILQYFYCYQEAIGINIEDTIKDFIKFKDVYNVFEEKDIYDSNNQIKETVLKINDAEDKKSFYSQMLLSNDKQYDYGVPILLITFNLNLDVTTSKDVEKFFTDYFLPQYDEKNNPLNGSNTYTVKFTWITDALNKTESKALYTFKLQGSSTGMYKSKNFSLSGLSSDYSPGKNSEYVTLFTPNFTACTNTDEKDDNYLTFLPENSFTFKADASDSTHSNNTAVGLFVNKNTKKFNDAINAQSNDTFTNKYKKYIKNCLCGFPILVFFEFPLSNEKNEYYYMGIYNFNLGRDSYLNLGYYDLNNIFSNLYEYGNKDNIVDLFDGNHNGFNEYEVYKQHYQPLNDSTDSTSNIKEALAIAEIQGGDKYFDFSQFDEHILFGYENKETMFGDFYSSKGKKFEDFEKQKVQDFVTGISLIGGKLFENLHKNMSESEEDNYGYDLRYSNHIKSAGNYYVTRSSNIIPNYKHQVSLVHDEYSSNSYKYQWNDSPINPEDYYENNFISFFTKFIGVQTIDDTSDPPTYDHNINKYENLLDYTSLVEYYTLCMAFGLVDSVMKNLNIKSFKRNGKFYIAFYDMDTALSRDNGGKYVSPFAFSDYWVSISNNNTTENIIYRDFYPDKALESVEEYKGHILDLNELKNIPRGYDIPSSYLFAIAKYAQVFYNAANLNILSGYNINPNYYWYTLRHDNDSPLANPNKFIENYFTKNIININKTLFGLNYRFKYLQKNGNPESQNMFIDTDLDAFHGRGLNSLKYWLSKRFHILDAYFNINCSQIPYKEYDISTDTWKNISVGDQNNKQFIYDPSFKDVINDTTNQFSLSLANDDIEINSSMFGNSKKYQGARRNTIIKALPYSPMMFIYQSDTEEFICVDPNTEYRFAGSPGAIGEDTITYGGSINWTYAYNLAPFISKDKLEITNKNLRNVNITSGTLSNLTLTNMQSLSEINITSENATCTIDCDNSQNQSTLNNLKTINLSKSKCSLNANTLNITNVDLSNNQSSGTHKIINCYHLNDVILNNTSGQTLEVNPVWNNNGKNELKNCKIEKINLVNTLHDNLKLIVENDEALSELNITGYSSIEINNCRNLRKLIISDTNDDNKKLKKLKVINCLNIEFTVNNKLSPNNVVDLSELNELESISFDSTTGFNKLILPNKDIELQYKAFYNTDLQYINYEDKDNNSHKLILCDNENDIERDCSIFYNSSFSLCSLYNNLSTNTNTQINLTFAVKEKLTSLKNIFAIAQNTVGQHKGVSHINYVNATYFINNLENKEYVISLERAFYRQDNISIQYNLINYFVDKNVDYICEKGKHMTLKGYKNLNTIESMFEYSNINFIDDYFFGTFDDKCSINSDTLNIFNFVPYDTLSYVHENALNMVKNKITGFLFKGVNENNLTRFAKFSIYNDTTRIETVNVHKFLFSSDSVNHEFSKMEELCGFNLDNIYDFSNLFTSYENNITSIHDVFTNLNQSIDSKCNVTNSINNLSVSELTQLTTLQNAFVSSDVNLNNIDRNKTVNIYTFINWNTQFSNLISDQNDVNQNSNIFNKKIFNFYKNVNLCDENNINNWKLIWKKLFNCNRIDYIFNKSIFIVKNDKPTLIIPECLTTNKNNIKTAIGLFESSTCYTYQKISEEYVEYKEIGITLNGSLDALINVQQISNMFENCHLNGNDNYPLPENLLSKLTQLTHCQYLFANTKILGNHKTYYNNSNTNSKEVYYKYALATHLTDNNAEVIIHNYALSDINYINKDIINNGYAFIPELLFVYNDKLKNIEYMFANSDFEGYIPQNLFNKKQNANNAIVIDFTAHKELEKINNFILNCKVLPQLYKEFKETDNVNIYNYTYKSDEKTKAYVFIPENFISSEKNRIESNIFNFNFLLSNSSINRLYLTSDKSLQHDSLTNVKLCFNPKTMSTISAWILNDNQTEYIYNQAETKNGIYDYGYINLCINKENENTYSEGLDSYKFDYVSSYLINEELASKYYGYIFKPNSVINYNYQMKQKIENNNICFLLCQKYVQKNNDPTIYENMPVSKHIVLPAIINTNISISDKYSNDDMYPKYSVYLNSISNKYYISGLFKNLLETNSSYINITTNLNNDDFNKDKLKLDISFINDENNIICTSVDDGFKLSFKYNGNIYYENIYQDITDETTAEFKQDLKQIIFNNYYLLFNKWLRDSPHKVDNQYYTINLFTYNSIIIYDNNKLVQLSSLPVNNYSSILKNRYIIKYLIDEITNEAIVQEITPA